MHSKLGVLLMHQTLGAATCLLLCSYGRRCCGVRIQQLRSLVGGRHLRLPGGLEQRGLGKIWS